jgi:hypothetical protein
MDDLCEKQNNFEKAQPPDSNFEKVTKRSTHIHLGQRAAKEIFGDTYRPSKNTTMEADINKCYNFFKAVGVFETPDVASTVNDNTFWQHVVAPTPTKNPKEWYSAKKDVPLTKHETKALEIFWDKSVLSPCDGKEEYVSASDDEDSMDRGARSVNSQAASAATIDELVAEKVNDLEDMMYALNGVENPNESMSMREVYHQSKKVAFDEGVTVLDNEKTQTEALKSLSGVT